MTRFISGYITTKTVKINNKTNSITKMIINKVWLKKNELKLYNYFTLFLYNSDIMPTNTSSPPPLHYQYYILYRFSYRYGTNMVTAVLSDYLIYLKIQFINSIIFLYCSSTKKSIFKLRNKFVYMKAYFDHTNIS